jgi:hypothetical protein
MGNKNKYRLQVTHIIDQSASGTISSPVKINAWSHNAVMAGIFVINIVPQIPFVEGVSGEYCGV